MEDTLTSAEELRIRAESSFFDDIYSKTEADPLNFNVSNLCDMVESFNHLAEKAQGKRILSIGGGIDYTAVHLANTGADVWSTDVSNVACEKTRMLASQYRLKGSLRVLNSSCEHLRFHEEFDLVLSKWVLHHVNFAKGVARIHDALIDKGVLIALEPICLSKVIGFLQANLPYHPQTFITPNEIKLSPKELSVLQRSFSKLEYQYFDLFARPSIAYVLGRIKASSLVPMLKKLDARLLQRVPLLNSYCQHILIRAEK